MPIMYTQVDQSVIDKVCLYAKFYNVTPDRVVNDALMFIFRHIDEIYNGDKQLLNG